MTTFSISEAGTRLDGIVESALRDRAPIRITGANGGAVVLVAAEEYEAMEETLHLLSTPANAAKIRDGLADYAAGKMQSGAPCD